MSRRNRHHLSAWQVFADLLTCTLGFFLLITSLLIVVPHLKQAHDGIKPKAEYLVTLTWGDHRNVDLDLWLKHDRCVIYYQSRECIDISLDRDSRGYISNAVVNPDGTTTVSPNQEVISIRALLAGDYLTAVNYYGKEDSDTAVDAKVELIKLNPVVTVVQSVTLHLNRVKETQNAIAFHIDADGSVTLQSLPPEDLISQVSQ